MFLGGSRNDGQDDMGWALGVVKDRLHCRAQLGVASERVAGVRISVEAGKVAALP
jgi:hypothetical protein